MSDKRAKYIILASIIFASIVGISQAQGLFELNDATPITPSTSFGYLGHVSVVLKDSNGIIKAYQQSDNIVVNRGRDCAADLTFDTGLIGDCEFVEWMAIGSSSKDIANTQTNLIDKTTNGNVELFEADRANPPLTKPAVGGAASVITYDKTFTILAADSGETIHETGLFDGESDAFANMFARSVFFLPVPVTTDDQLTVRWTITTVGVNLI